MRGFLVLYSTYNDERKMMANTLTLIVTTPANSNLSVTALNIAQSAIENGVELIGVFFYQQGVLNAAKYLSIPSDEYQIADEWQNLHEQHNIPLHLCITAAEKNALSDDKDIIETSNINDCFTVSGLGELVELTASADRVIQL